MWGLGRGWATRTPTLAPCCPPPRLSPADGLLGRLGEAVNDTAAAGAGSSRHLGSSRSFLSGRGLPRPGPGLRR